MIAQGRLSHSTGLPRRDRSLLIVQAAAEESCYGFLDGCLRTRRHFGDGMLRLKRPSRFTIAMSAVVLLLVVCIASFSLLRAGLFQRDAQGTSLLRAAGQGNGAPQNGSRLQDGGPSQGSRPLDGTGPFRGGGPLPGAGPLQGNAPMLTAAPIGVGDPILGPNGSPLLPPAVWPPDAHPAMPIWSLAPAQPLSTPTLPSDPGPSQQPESICVTCFVPPPPPAPTPPPNNIVTCANVTCN